MLIKPLQLPDFAFSWPRLLPNCVSIAFRSIFPPLQETLKCLKGSAAPLGHSCRTRFCQVLGHACRLIKLPASRLCLFLARSLAKCCFYRVSKLMDGILSPLQETLRCLKGSAAALGHSCRTRFCQVPGHACPLSCQLPDFAFSWPRLLPNGVSIASRSCWMALFLRFRKLLYASKALLQLQAAVTAPVFARFLAMPVD